MFEVLPKDVREGLKLAQKRDQRKKSRLRVHAGDRIFTILRFWEEGFALDADDAPNIRGLVDVYDGTRHLLQCLIVASEEDGDEMIYEFKRATPHSEKAPLDYERDANAPVALIGQS